MTSIKKRKSVTPRHSNIGRRVARGWFLGAPEPSSRSKFKREQIFFAKSILIFKKI